MELKQLRHFVAVVESGTLSGASHVLHITQPALTRSIKNLEAQLKAELLERRSRGVVTTDAGERLYHQAKMILNEAERTASDVSATARGERGKLSVGVAAMFAGDPMTLVLDKLAASVPGLRVDVKEGFFEDLIAGLKTSQMEALITNFPPGVADENLIFEPLVQLHVYFFVGAEHPLAREKEVSMEILQKYDLAMVRQDHVTSLVSDLFAAESLTLKEPAIASNSLALLRSLVLSNAYVTLLPEHYLSDDLQAGRLVKLALPGTPFIRRSGLILRRLDSQRPAVQHFIEAARAAFATWPDKVT